MEPQHAITYNNSNTNKKVIYRTFVTNNYPAVAAGGNFNQLINSGIVHPTGVLIVPFLGAVTGTNGGLGDNQWKSCFDTCPCTTSAVSLTNLQVSVISFIFCSIDTILLLLISLILLQFNEMSNIKLGILLVLISSISCFISSTS
jgi:hypothetical protein